MNELPPTVMRYLQTLTEPGAAFVRIDAGNRIVTAGGDLHRFGLAHVRPGDDAETTVDCLAGMLPVTSAAEILPLVLMTDEAYANLHLLPDAAGGSCVVLTDATGEATQRQALQQRGNELSLARNTLARQKAALEVANEFVTELNELAQQINGEMPVAPLLERLCDLARRTSDGHCATIVDRTRGPDERSVATSGPDAPGVSPEEIGELFGDLREEIRIRDRVDADDPIRRFAPDVTHDVTIPLRLADQRYGVLCVLRSGARSFEAAELHRLEQIATQAAAALCNAMLFDQLKDRNRELREFSFYVSHDLKAPLRAIRGQVPAISDSDAEPTASTPVRTISRALDDADALIADLLQLARLGNEASTRSSLATGAFIADLLTGMGLPDDVAVTIEGDWPTITTNRTLLGQILRNLIDNAIAYSHPPRRVEIMARLAAPTTLVIGVQDNGIGIEERHLDSIFRPFQRLHSGETFRGTGIGLAIVTKATRLLGGSISVRSTVGAGSLFEVSLPLSRIDLPASS